MQCPACRSGGPPKPAERGPALPHVSEDDVEAAIIAWLRFHGWHITKTSAKRHAKGVTAGTPDLYARHVQTKQRAWIEVKKPDGVVSEAQVRWHEDERASGGIVIVAYSVTDVVAALASLDSVDLSA